MHDQLSAITPSKKSSGMKSDASDPLLYDRLIEAVALRRDREAFASLFQYFAPRLKAWLMKSGATAAAAEDFAQDTLLTVWRKADLFDARKARASTWIFTIARNRRLDMMRRDGRAAQLPEITFVDEDVERPDDILVASDEARRVRQALAQLKPDQVEILKLAYFADHPHSAIAQQLDLPLGTVKSRIRNAVIKLRALLEIQKEASQ